MSVRLKTKLSLGLVFLFIVIVLFGVMGLYYINRLSDEGRQVLQNNYESLVYCNRMMQALEVLHTDKNALGTFRENLAKQQGNITEVGEREATDDLTKNFNEMLADPKDSSNYADIRRSINKIQELNEMAIFRKSSVAQKTADSAKDILTILFTILTLVAFTFIFNLPGIISDPIRSLAEGIRAIAAKDYKKRIYLRQGDEFGELAESFNTMAQKLDEYESSNLAQIKFEKSRIETIINQMRDGIIGLDDKRNILFLNAVAEKLIGLKEADIAGLYAPDVALTNDLMRTLLQDDAEKKDLKIYADNKESYFSKDVLKVTNNAEVIGQVIVLRNITPFHELNEAKTNFIATVSHELKTPISSIKMSARLLGDLRVGALNNEQQELIRSITDDSDRLLKITGELLNLSQVETGKIQLKLQPASPADIVEQAIQAVSLQAQQKHINIQSKLADNLPTIQADVEKTSWVLINFLTNAIKYSPEDSGVEVSACCTKNTVEFMVKDQGRGIDEKYLPRIFDRYFKVPGTHERNGTGLGLSISKEFIEAQGGRIWVHSRLGEGSQFGFTFSAT
ncbi:HAMP domain-containing sensor histidine kinase [Puia dinghuensis]|uniref:histidine kinase n=1 Tax=Puia dinghuensis TaxID=1792502 RepID=A0A8J2UA93_9BACT|nr:ATP-binding protein [Puia dinghuensis]GGA89827.1 PAS domain-containing sensor histidine kinase [Puia dinghuensis]